MKICLINNLYKPYDVGGAERVVEKQAQELAGQGHSAVIITWRPWAGWGCWKPEKSEEQGMTVYRFWAPNIFSYKNLNKHNFVLKLVWHFFDIWNFWSGWIIKRILQNEKPSIVEVHNLMGLGYGFIPSPKGEGSLLNALKKANNNTKLQSPEKGFLTPSGIRNVCVLHDVQLVEPSGVLPWNHKKDSVWQKIYSWVMKRRMGSPDVVVCLSEFMKDFYQSRGWFKKSEWRVEKPHVSHIPYPISRIPYPESRIPKFIFVGSLVEHKGIEVLMEAWEKVHSDHAQGGEESLFSASNNLNNKTIVKPSEKGSLAVARDLQLAIVGDGILFDEVKKWAENHPEVKVHGRLEGKDLEKIYQKCDVLIFPSICIENRPTVILEAKKYGLKIIASDTGGVGEFLSNEDALVEPGDAEGLTKALKCDIVNY